MIVYMVFMAEFPVSLSTHGKVEWSFSCFESLGTDQSILNGAWTASAATDRGRCIRGPDRYAPHYWRGAFEIPLLFQHDFEGV